MKKLVKFNLGSEDIIVADEQARGDIESLNAKLSAIPKDLDTHLSLIDNSLSTKVSLSYSATTKTITFTKG